MWTTFTRTWRNRLFIAAFITATMYVSAVLLRFGPQPVPFLIAMAAVLSLMWLIFDIADEDPTEWLPALPAVSDRADEATSDLRILSSHRQATEPSAAVRERLVSLARARDPSLAETLRRELEPVRRMSPAEIDAILTRIEEARDRS